MSLLRNLTIALFVALAVYTVFAVINDGLNFIPGFIADLMSLTWTGQINLDFVTYLTLSALWVAWRHHFTPGGIVMGVIVFVGAMLLFAPYLLYAISKSNGDFAVLLLGENRARSGRAQI